MQPSSWSLALASATLLACAEAPPPGARADTTRAAVPAESGTALRDSTWVQVTRPTLIAFYPPSASALIDADDDAATALDDFGYHLASAADSLRALGVHVVSVGSRVLHVVQDRRTTVFTVPRDSADLGYYVVAPGRAPVVYYGVRTDSDLLDAVHQYLRRPRTPP